jgi:nucleotide-binding universal stress UspA family protein
MVFEKSIHITNSKEVRATEVQRFAGLRKLGLQEVLFFHPSNGDTWKEPLEAVGLQARTLAVDGPTIPSLLNAARKEGVSFISTTMGEQNKGVFRRSFAKELLKTSHVPVMLMPTATAPSSVDQVDMFDHVIFATDWSEACREVMRYLLRFKGIIKELEIVHVVDKRLSIKELRSLRYMLSAWRSAFLGHLIDAESHIYAGKRHEEILLAAKDYGGTCIVMGASQTSSIKRLLRQPCPYRVAEDSQVPTFVVP